MYILSMFFTLTQNKFVFFPPPPQNSRIFRNSTERGEENVPPLAAKICKNLEICLTNKPRRIIVKIS